MSLFHYQNKEVFYHIEGSEGPVLVLLNGIMMSVKSWEPFKDSFKPHLRLLRLDFFDQGQSSFMSESYTQQIQVDLLKALLDHLKFDQVYLAGISYGASVALQFAIAFPERVSRLLLFNGVAKTSPWLKAIGDGWNEVAKTREGLAYYHITIPFIYSPRFYQTQLAWMENRKKLLVEVFSNPVFLDAMIRLTQSAESHDTLDALHTLTMPTLIVASEDDYLTPPFEQEAMHESIQQSKLVYFPKTGHASMYEQPSLFVSTILGFCLEKNTHYTL